MATQQIPNPTRDDLIRILFIAANPASTSPLRCDRELKAVRAALARAGHRDRFAPIDHKPAAEWRDLSSGLRANPHVVHYAGHGERGGHLVCEDDAGNADRVSLAQLRDLIEALGVDARVVVLNACWQAEDADVLLRHVDFVIGMKRPVPDTAAIAFAEELYDGCQSSGYRRQGSVGQNRQGSVGQNRQGIVGQNRQGRR